MKNKVLRWVLIVVFAVVLLCIFNFTRNYMILNKLKEKTNELKSLSEFSFVIENGNVKHRLTKVNHIAKVEDFEDNRIIYFNTETEEMIKEDMETGEKIYYAGPAPSSIELVLLDIDVDFYELLLTNIITSKEIEGEKCYKIKFNTLSTTYYISAETGLTMAVAYDDGGNEIYYTYELEDIEDIDFEMLKSLSEKEE
ncbi:MAG: hypothetical protein IJ867_00980 [Clostridia bacterium]|nr:hypothetical protein [Clostridia bacterium]